MSLKEIDVGISCYLNGDLKGFDGVIKKSFVDFVVQEIDLEGKVAEYHNWEDQITALDEEIKEDKLDDEEFFEKISPYFEDKDLLVLKQWLVKEDDGSSLGQKEERACLHKLFKNFEIYETDTVESCVRVRCASAVTERRFKKQKMTNDEPAGKYTVFSLYKEGKDTSEALNLIAKILRIQTKKLSFAGNKDRRAVTIQRVAVRGLSRKRILTLNKAINPNMKISDPIYADKAMELGDLLGNRFGVAIRQFSCTKIQSIEATMDSLKENGFINYFGMQRFGTSQIGSHEIGLALLKEHWEKAVELIMAPKIYDNENVKKARIIWRDEKDAEKALRMFPSSFTAEKQILYFFSKEKNGTNQKAIGSISRNLRTIYLHSVQSYVWNKVASLRIQNHGTKVLVGDLAIYKTVPKVNGIFKIDSLEDAIKPIENEDQINETSIHDIVLPVPGWQVTYPQNETSKYYDLVMGDLGLDKDKMRHSNKFLNLPGDYRPLIVKPSDLKWEIEAYEDFKLPLLPIGSSQKDNQGENKALLIEFNLPSSCYATMLLREAMRIDTSPGHQKTLNDTESSIEITEAE